MLNSKRGVGRSAGSSLRNILGGVFALALLIGYSVYHANFVIGRSLLLAFPDWEVTYRGGWPLPGGGAVASDIVMVPPDGEEGGTIRFKHLRVDVPFFEYYMSAFSRRRGSLLKSIRNLNVELSDGHGTLNGAFSNELAAFGNFTAAPFEAEGCVGDTIWLEKEVNEMGLSPRGVDLSLAFNSEGKTLIKNQSLSVPGVGRVDVRREMIKHDSFSLFSLIETGLSEVVSDEWHVKDQGFAAARNHHCALTDKISEDAFVERHMLSVKRLLQAVGLAVSPEVADAYRTYASKGGGFDMVVRYEPPLSVMKDAAKEMAELLSRVQGTFTVAGKKLPLALAAVPERPLPETDAPLSTFEVVQREGGAPPAERVTAPPPAPAAPTATPAATPPAPGLIVVQADAPDPKALKAAEAAAAKVAPAAAPIVAPVPAEVEEGEGITDYRQLAAYVGRYLTVHVQGRPAARVEILSAAADGSIVVRRHMTGGNVDYVLDRTHFERADP